MATLDAIKAKIQKLQSQADALMVKSKQAAIQKIHAIMLEAELTLAEIGEPKSGKRTKAIGQHARKGQAVVGNGKLPPKYRNPKTGETWSGHARPPAWIKDVKDRSKFLIDPAGVETVKATSSKSAKGAAKKKAAVPAKYQDPATGATWTGRGRAPAWIAGEEDRSKFLIAAEA
ncbi:H-NS histone family protein [Burkholderia ubonensis]|uniref:H-NS histone family protein n=1 Tax=Burkholderia ubonensis TaxID=101571 RepID=UPI00075A16AC|nr:H-NS histone family protein [Burkholderia ubonensis]KVP40122.1 hypothetical protein WJ87_06200 [Burkholderia ubonensis]